MSIASLELSTRVVNALDPDMSIEEFLKLKEPDVRRIKNLGRKCWLEISETQRHLLGPTRTDVIERLKHELRDFHQRAHRLGLTLIVVEGYPRLARVYRP